MKVHYINILLFALPLNILEHNQRNLKSTTSHTYTNRSLCECELYAPANYDNDTEMKEVMDNFSKQTQQRFEEYDERMKTTRQKCKDKCDKEIQKIILKDKLEKELMEKFATLHTDIQSDAIPTCVCEKSIADKVEKECLKCAQNLGGIVAPSSGVLAGIAEGALYAWKPTALDAAIKAAIAKGAADISAAAKAAGIKAGKDLVIGGLKYLNIDKLVPEICEQISNASHYNELMNFAEIIRTKRAVMCGAQGNILDQDMCRQIGINLRTFKADGRTPDLPDAEGVQKTLTNILDKAETTAKGAAEAAKETATTGITNKRPSCLKLDFNSSISSINADI
ncbi:rifin PIR protein, putative [Plasmodium reichenowi]|uniref:Rifin PIR protein, putative n=1 Tax=Plasmodium reichenowi TaxID=5854 RepID=A0A2P9DSU4_PLARE|nr:rifin PIR protein, putative [Plasmodium reichenowi]